MKNVSENHFMHFVMFGFHSLLLRYFIFESSTATQAYFCCFVWMLIENTQKRAFRYFFKALQKQFETYL